MVINWVCQKVRYLIERLSIKRIIILTTIHIANAGVLFVAVFYLYSARDDIMRSVKAISYPLLEWIWNVQIV